MTKPSFGHLLITMAMATKGARANNWLLPLGVRLSSKQPAKGYNTPSFLDLMRNASKANPRTILRIKKAYDVRLKEVQAV